MSWLLSRETDYGRERGQQKSHWLWMDEFFISTVVSQREEQDRGSHDQIFLPQHVARIILVLTLTLVACFTLSLTFYIYL